MHSLSALRNLRLHEGLLTGLQRLGISELTQLQTSVPITQVMSTLASKDHTLVMAETGTGKSLACLLYSLNRVLGENGREGIVQSLRDRSFDDIFPEFSSSKVKETMGVAHQHGALVLVPTRELILQHYKLIRQLDSTSSIALHRTTSIADLAAITRHIVLSTQQPGENMNNLVENYGITNMVKTLNWRQWDVVISTPKTLNELMRHKAAKGQMDLDPSVVYLDECDILFM